MSPRSKEQFDQMREKSRQVIMKAALELFTHQGFHGTSVSKIAKAAGVSTGLMYNYFSSKVELLLAIVQDGMEQMAVSFQILEPIVDPAEKLKALLEVSFEIAQSDMRFWTLYFNLITQPDLPDEIHQIFSNFISGMIPEFERIFTDLGYEDANGEAWIFAQ